MLPGRLLNNNLLEELPVVERTIFSAFPGLAEHNKQPNSSGNPPTDNTG